MGDHTIKVNIANRPYRLKIATEEEEELIRKSAEHIESLIKDYGSKYHYNDFQDLLAMISLQLANSYISMEKNMSYRDHEMTDQLKEIDLFLSSKIT
jgi:cell division protein ZapA (FtsZ GTPase activity inhibitor)